MMPRRVTITMWLTFAAVQFSVCMACMFLFPSDTGPMGRSERTLYEFLAWTLTILSFGAPVFAYFWCRRYVAWCNRHIPPAPRCVECGYNLTGNVSGVCPECGERI